MFYYNKGQKIKDVSLVVLIIISVVFAFRLWYGFSIHNLFAFMGGNSNLDNLKVSYIYIKPNKIIACNGYNRDEYKFTNTYGDGYYQFDKIYKQLIEEIFNSKDNNMQVKDFKKKYWFDLSSGQSILIDYKCPIDYRVFEKKFKVSVNKKFSSVKQAIMIPDFGNNSLKLYIYDSVDNKIISFEQNVVLIDLEYYFNTFVNSKDNNIKYIRMTSFDNRNIENQIYATQDFKKINLFNVKMKKEFDINSENNIDKLKKVYFENPLVVRESKDKSGGITCFDDERFLKLDKEGSLRYNYTGYTSGKDEGITGAYEKAVEFINSHGGMPQNSYISILSNKGVGKYKVAFDYMVDGIPVEIQDKKNNRHAISVELLNGNVIEYDRFVKIANKYGNGYNIKVDPSDALNEAIKKEERYASFKEINDLDLGYNIEAKRKDNIVEPEWCVEINKNTRIFVSVSEISSQK